MLHLVISVLWFLVILCLIVGAAWLVVWVLEQLGIPVPPMVMKIGLLVICLLCLIYFLTLIAGNGGVVFPQIR